MENQNPEMIEEAPQKIEEQSAKSMWQQTKESWYDKVNLTVKQLDIIIACGIGGLIITFILIALDAMNII